MPRLCRSSQNFSTSKGQPPISKRTVGIAEILYGITMQEKGVSKKVAVKVEDVTNMLN